MFRFFARPAARLALILPLLALGSCGGNNTGAIITVPNSVVAADLNGDGIPDIAVVVAQIDETGLTQKPGLLGVEINPAAHPGSFTGGTNFETSSAPPSGLAVGDLSGTGTHDIVVANLNASTLSVFKETSPTSGAYAQAVTITVGGGPNDVQIADINGDGLPDLIVADNTGAVEYLLQNPAAPGTFEAAVKMVISNPALSAQGTGFIPRGIAVAVGDLNGDGLPDIAVTSFDVNGDYGQVTIFWNNPASPGTFLATPTNITAYGEPSQIRIADVNQDGVNDIIVACQGLGGLENATAAPGTMAYEESLYGAMVILQNSGAPGTFADPVVNAGIQGAISLAIADLNNDGLPDIAMTSLYPSGQGAIGIMINDTGSPGTFTLSASYAGSGQPASIAIADFNHDGLPDIVVADGVASEWYANQTAAPGTFVLQEQVGNFLD